MTYIQLTSMHDRQCLVADLYIPPARATAYMVLIGDSTRKNFDFCSGFIRKGHDDINKTLPDSFTEGLNSQCQPLHILDYRFIAFR